MRARPSLGRDIGLRPKASGERLVPYGFLLTVSRIAGLYRVLPEVAYSLTL